MRHGEFHERGDDQVGRVVDYDYWGAITISDCLNGVGRLIRLGQVNLDQLEIACPPFWERPHQPDRCVSTRLKSPHEPPAEALSRAGDDRETAICVQIRHDPGDLT